MSGAASAGDAFLGLDIGTSSIKAVLIDGTNACSAKRRPRCRWRGRIRLWSEQEPAHWADGVQEAVAALRRAAPEAFARLAGVGLSGQMHGAVLLDARRQALRPAILWNDGRSFAECAELERRVPDFRQRAGNIAMPGFTAPKLLWVAAHEPEVFKATRRVLLPKDYVRLRLSGEAMFRKCPTPPARCGSTSRGAGGTTDCWRRPGLTLPHMPRLVEGSAVSALSVARNGRRLGSCGSPRSDRRRRGRQRRRGGRRRRRRGGRGLRLARHLGGDLCGDGSLRRRCRSARCTPSATRCRAAGTAWR